MERLTSGQSGMCQGLCCGNENYCSDDCELSKALDKLACYENLEEQGLLIKLFCKFNENIIYYIDKSNNLHYGYIEEIKINEFGIKYTYINSDNEWDITFTEEDIGKIIFLTRKEAEETLKSSLIQVIK